MTELESRVDTVPAETEGFLVTQPRAAVPHRLRRTGQERLEVFTLFPPRA